ncbi:MAG TPA: decarboxylating 6-phosphogluconate dehydrogenase [Anaerolineales bacterium]|nr:decarboxylating 6-phosphogluconate dehydrogenase [Anaerolineales bacterium]
MNFLLMGMGKMGANMATRLRRAGLPVHVFDRNPPKMAALEALGAIGVPDLTRVDQVMSAPRAVWSMLPAGAVTEEILSRVTPHLAPGDIVIDGGNSHYKDSQRRAKELAQKGLAYLDVGVSGGVWGLTEGYSLMIGGEAAAVERLRPYFEALAPGRDRGWGHVGPSGAGHFVKMVHNGIEYGMMQAYGEGFEILRKKTDLDLDLHQIGEVWRHGSVVRSWLLDLAVEALKEDPALKGVEAWVADSGEGRWTIQEAMDLDVPAPVISLALQMRLVSRQQENFSAKLLAALRNQFGGHAIKTR